MEKPWSDKLIHIKPYVPGTQSENKNIIKLNANENPYPPSPAAIDVIRGFDCNSLKLYPSSSALKLRQALAVHHGLAPEQVFVGNGSDEVIAFAFMAFFNSKKPILFPDITYSFYPVWCSLFGIPYETPAVSNDFLINASDYFKDNGGVIIPNPNAPTGISEGKEFIETILQNNKDVIVIIDEAYVDFGGYSSIELLKKYENLVIIHTFSKSRSLAGLRIGAAFASNELISVLDSVKNSYNSYTIDSIALESGTASVLDNQYFLKTLEMIKNTREYTANKLKAMGFLVCKSHSNFLFVTHPSFCAEALFQYLKDHDIFIRHFNLPRIDNYLRITIGTDSDMDKMLDCIKEYILKQ